MKVAGQSKMHHVVTALIKLTAWSVWIPSMQLSRSVTSSLRVVYQHRLCTNCHRVARWSRKQEPSGIQEH